MNIADLLFTFLLVLPVFGVIRKRGRSYVVLSKKGRVLGRTRTKKAARRRLRQVEFFKRRGRKRRRRRRRRR